MGKILEIANQRFKSLTVLRKAPEKQCKAKNPVWECKCDCGDLCYVAASDLTRGRWRFCKSCLTERSRLSPYKVLYSAYKRNAKKVKRSFNLTLKEFALLIDKPCYYCGTKPQQCLQKKGMAVKKKLYNGIDRIDNLNGYIDGNCRPCCRYCNFAKYNVSNEEFEEWIERLVAFRIIK